MLRKSLCHRTTPANYGTVANNEFECGQLVRIEGSPAIMSTVFKTSKDGKSTILRLHSVSDNNEDVELKWVDRIPASVHFFNIEEEENIVEITPSNSSYK